MSSAHHHHQQLTLGLVDREKLGRAVRAVWLDWAREQPDPKPSWLQPWEQLSEPDREVDRRIGETLFRLGRASVLAPVRHRRICADCGLLIGRRHKWHIGADSKIRHRDCANPVQPGDTDSASASASASRAPSTSIAAA